MRITLSQVTYDAILKRLDKHHKHHKGDTDFPMIKKGLEKNARTGLDGVEVDLRRLEFASDAIRDNMKFAGQKYGTAPDKSVLLDIEEAIAEHEARTLALPDACKPIEPIPQPVGDEDAARVIAELIAAFPDDPDW